MPAAGTVNELGSSSAMGTTPPSELRMRLNVASSGSGVSELTELDVERHTHYAIEAAFADTDTKCRLASEVSAWWAGR